jgi:hypothetical protein
LGSGSVGSQKRKLRKPNVTRILGANVIKKAMMWCPT